jgi:hypothetical protein
MRFSEVLAASLVAPLVAAHGGVQGAPKLFGLPNDVKIRNPTPRAARAAAQGPHHLITRQGGNSENRCGPEAGNAVCAAGYCCSGAVCLSYRCTGLNICLLDNRDTVETLLTIAMHPTVSLISVRVVMPTRLLLEPALATMPVPRRVTSRTAVLVFTAA